MPQIVEATKSSLEIVNEYKKEKRLEKNWFPLMTYDIVDSGYPHPTLSTMVARPFGGTNKNNELLNGNGEFCKTDDVKKEITRLKMLLKKCLNAGITNEKLEKQIKKELI